MILKCIKPHTYGDKHLKYKGLDKLENGYSKKLYCNK